MSRIGKQRRGRGRAQVQNRALIYDPFDETYHMAVSRTKEPPALNEVRPRLVDVVVNGTLEAVGVSLSADAIGLIMRGSGTFAPMFLVLKNGDVFGAMGVEADLWKPIGTRRDDVIIKGRTVSGTEIRTAAHRARLSRPGRISLL